jgi:hypothetical protein
MGLPLQEFLPEELITYEVWRGDLRQYAASLLPTHEQPGAGDQPDVPEAPAAPATLKTARADVSPVRPLRDRTGKPRSTPVPVQQTGSGNEVGCSRFGATVAAKDRARRGRIPA